MNLNSFVARLFATSTLRTGHLGIRQLRWGLEEVLDIKTILAGGIWVASCRARVACEWLFHGGPWLLRDCLLHKFSAEEDGKSSEFYAPGKLFTGCKAFSPERWGFWKRKLHQYEKAPTYENDLPRAIQDALDVMTRAEKAFASGGADQYN